MNIYIKRCDEESDMDEIYYRFEKYFDGNEWVMKGDSHEELEGRIYQHIWKPLRRGDYMLQRYLNSNLAEQLE